MNDKQKLIESIIANVIKCCAVESSDGRLNITKEDVVGKSREDHIVMTRCLVVEQLIHGGFSINTIAFLLNRTVQAVKHLRKLSLSYYETSRAYRLATSEATLLNKDVEPIFV